MKQPHAPSEYTVRRVQETGLAVYYHAALTADGRDGASIRVGKDHVFLCLTCHSAVCAHAQAATTFARAEATAGGAR